ncbi:ABC transporter permease [Mesorhizobium sp.]|jgi:ribose/xylose/arabinose/galactoside ABC-type transport system permease subunit|uniref:ABC transporter permease n=1 Tax=Mesorhizobium sp. TaxID=1871066 RepID=UPI003562DACF
MSTISEHVMKLGAPRLTQPSGATLVAVATVVVAVVAGFTLDGFATASNFRGLSLSLSLIGIVAVGLSFITICGQVFSLSISTLAALSTICFASFLHLGAIEAMLVTIVMATCLGAVQGFIVGHFESDPIIVTIAANAVMVGAGQLLTDGQTIMGIGDTSIFNATIFNFLPVEAAIFLVVTLCLHVALRYTVPGRQMTLLGLNDRAARISAIPRTWLIVSAFAICGATTGIAGALLSAQSSSGQLQLGAGFGTGAIVAVVVGGVAVTGGIGTPIGAAVGAIFVGLLVNVASLAGFDYSLQRVTEGVLVLAVVVLAGVYSRESRQRR